MEWSTIDVIIDLVRTLAWPLASFGSVAVVAETVKSYLKDKDR
jgi:hypothetical protein